MPPATPQKPYNWPLTFLFWLLVCAFFVVRAHLNAASAPLLADTDDAMRLTVIRDWMAGQNWFDHTQYRLNVPFGAQIHWSRLIDAPIAGLITFFGFFAPAHAETLAVYVWPLALLLGLLILTSRLSVTLAGPQAQLAGLALPVFSLSIMAEFGPGRIDHHSVQILLSLALVLATVLAAKNDAKSARNNAQMGIWAGLAAATSLAIGTEGIVLIAAAIMAFGLLWTVDATKAAAMRNFGVAFALGTLGHFLLFLPPSSYFAVHCDVLSIVYLVAAMGVGLAFSLLPLLPTQPRQWPLRLMAGGLAGALLVGALLVNFPLCLGGPYAGLDPWLKANWIDHVAEAETAFEALHTMTGFALSLLLPVAFALIVGTWAAFKSHGEQRRAWLVFMLFLLLAALTLLIQIRGARLAVAMTVPAGAWLIVWVRTRYLRARAPGWALALVLAWLGFSGIPIMMAFNLVALRGDLAAQTQGAASKAKCLMPEAFAQLADMPAQRVMTPIDLGAHTLLYTKHSVVGAPYHRNERGLLDTYHFLNGTPEEAQQILARRDIHLVAICPALPEMRGLPDAAPDSLVRQLLDGKTPSWLREISKPGSTLRIFTTVGAAPGS